MESGATPLVAGVANGPVLARFSAFWPPNSFIISHRTKPSGPELARSLALESYDRTRNPHRPPRRPRPRPPSRPTPRLRRCRRTLLRRPRPTPPPHPRRKTLPPPHPILACLLLRLPRPQPPPCRPPHRPPQPLRPGLLRVLQIGRASCRET